MEVRSTERAPILSALSIVCVGTYVLGLGGSRVELSSRDTLPSLRVLTVKTPLTEFYWFSGYPAGGNRFSLSNTLAERGPCLSLDAQRGRRLITLTYSLGRTAGS